MVFGGFCMDTFIEQLITIKKTAKTWALYFLIALLAIIIIAVAYLFIPTLIVIIAALVIFGVYKLYSLTNIEYEYIVTNSTMDIDKITAKSSRKRVLSFELTAVERIEKYRKELPQDILKDCLFTCNQNDENAVLLVIHPDGKPKKSIVISPNDKVKDAMKKFLPKYVAESLI